MQSENLLPHSQMRKEIRIKGAIFDVDGTLLDSMEIWEDTGERYLKARGIEAPPGLIRLLAPMSLEESSVYISRHFTPGETPEEIKAGILGTVEKFYLHEAQLKPVAREFLRALRDKGIPMVVATTNEAHLIRAAFDRLGITGFFQDILSCSEYHLTKREPGIYREAAAHLGTSPEETVVFEDVLYALCSAKRGGFHTVAVEDRTSEADREEIRRTAELYLRDLRDLDLFWGYAN